MPTQRRWPAPWVFSLLILPLGMIYGEARDASTLYSLLNAAVSLPFVYVTWLDGVGFRYFGTRGLLWTDAGLNLLVFGIVAVVFITCGLSLRPGSQTSGLESDLTSA